MRSYVPDRCATSCMAVEIIDRRTMADTPYYKRGTFTKNGKLYGYYPDGKPYRIYSTTDRPFLQLVDVDGETFLRIRQATEQGYTDCPCPGAADLSYPSSALRRSRTVGGEVIKR